MKNLERYINYVYFILRILILVDIVIRTKADLNNCFIFTGLFLFILVNDYLRHNYFYRNQRKYYASLLMSMLISPVIIILLSGYVSVYLYMIIYEIILYNDGKIAKLLLKGELLIVLLLFIGSSISLDIIYWQTDLVDILMSFLLWFFYLIALFSYKSLIKAKRKVDKLNQELALSDEENKRLLLANERNRIAGEIHDNLGHNLVALNMHLDGLKHMLGTDNKQIAAIISKTQTITKNSLTDLRKVVYALKDDDNENITTTIKKIIANIESLNTVKVFLNINEAVNELMEIKDLICSIIKESLTNSIKHGLASLVYLDIIVNNEQLTILIKDNGVGCKKIVKGNGLKGIDLKVTNRGGKVEYQTASSGFETKIIIPKIGDDYCENSLGIS